MTTHVINLDEADENVLEQLADIINKSENLIEKKGQVALNFLLKKNGKEKKFVYNLSKDEVDEGKKNYAFPIMVEEYLKDEFGPKAAKNKKIVDHVTQELKKDPYWNDRVVDLIQELQKQV